jgi:hypothetical protein
MRVADGGLMQNEFLLYMTGSDFENVSCPILNV